MRDQAPCCSLAGPQTTYPAIGPPKRGKVDEDESCCHDRGEPALGGSRGSVPKAEPGLVLVKIHASGMCYTDVWATQGAGGDIYPQTPGHEVVGEIIEVGAGVHTRKVGDRVGTTWVQSSCGRCSYCRQNRPLTGQTAMNCDSPRTTGFATQGGHAEYIAISAEGTVLLPDGLDYTDAAPMMCAGYTTWSGLRDAEPKPGDRIAVLGIGGLGHVAVQFSKALGFETIAITHSPDKHKLATDLGADIVVADGKSYWRPAVRTFFWLRPTTSTPPKKRWRA